MFALAIWYAIPRFCLVLRVFPEILHRILYRRSAFRLGLPIPLPRPQRSPSHFVAALRLVQVQQDQRAGNRRASAEAARPNCPPARCPGPLRSLLPASSEQVSKPDHHGRCHPSNHHPRRGRGKARDHHRALTGTCSLAPCSRRHQSQPCGDHRWAGSVSRDCCSCPVAPLRWRNNPRINKGTENASRRRIGCQRRRPLAGRRNE